MQFLNRRLTVDADYYHDKTIDLVNDVSLSQTSGFSSYKDNMRAQNGNPTVPPQGAPPKKEKKDAKEEVHYPLYNGMSVGLDLWGIGSSVFGGDFLSSEVAVDVNLKNRFFPIAELGYGSTDTWSDKGIHYKSNYGRADPGGASFGA